MINDDCGIIGSISKSIMRSCIKDLTLFMI